MKKILYFLGLSFFVAFSMFSEEKKNPVKVYGCAEGAYYAKYESETGGDHTTKITGPYSGFEALVKFGVEKTFSTPLGEHWLLSGANIWLNSYLEVTPIHLKPAFDFSFTPLPFLSFGCGAQAGFGWEAMGLRGMELLNESKKEYESVEPFSHVYQYYYGSGTFMFDTGAIIQNDWAHVVILSKYTVFYEALSGMGKGEMWGWMLSQNKVNGLQYEEKLIIGYQMPLKLRLAGVILNFTGYYDGDDFGKFNKNYDGEFMQMKICPFLQFNFTKKDQLNLITEITANRSFDQDYDKYAETAFLTKKGREWFWNRLAFSYKHYF